MPSRCYRNDRSGEWCLFEAVYPAPSARPFSKGLLLLSCNTEPSFTCLRSCPFCHGEKDSSTSLGMTTQELHHSLEKLAALSFYDAPHHNPEPANLNPEPLCICRKPRDE